LLFEKVIIAEKISYSFENCHFDTIPIFHIEQCSKTIRFRSLRNTQAGKSIVNFRFNRNIT
jgi:hypothetical protein